ncbi:DegT/DnrJ/EryC1/StrS family aminotransferase [Rhodobacteraceae bacterium]|nr:DegT/DnrJ/EryC1/StrS family aminotransferase [Paracoccaceae bacterium]
MTFDNDVTHANIQHKGISATRNEELVNLASSLGVPRPAFPGVKSAPSVVGRLNFIENKIYDLSRISELLSLSISTNHHANFGPVCRLLEAVISKVAKIESHQRVIAVSSGTSALLLACNSHAFSSGKAALRWVTSAFTFQSSILNMLSSSIVIDCDPRGRFDLNRLKELPLESYDGVIFTNVFSQMADWTDVDTFCKTNNKKLVVDNATGLMDRIEVPIKGETPIEIISAHHTKPWGVGECGMIICSDEQEPLIRKLSNFGAGLDTGSSRFSFNFKLSDLAAAAVIDRLERISFWAPLYQQQQDRILKIIDNELENIISLKGTTKPKSPRSFAPFCTNFPIENINGSRVLTLAKYYKPLKPSDEFNMDISNSLALYDRILCIPNSPEYLSISSDEIVSELSELLSNATCLN